MSNWFTKLLETYKKGLSFDSLEKLNLELSKEQEMFTQAHPFFSSIYLTK